MGNFQTLFFEDAKLEERNETRNSCGRVNSGSGSIVGSVTDAHTLPASAFVAKGLK
jgi:hypothetical protein